MFFATADDIVRTSGMMGERDFALLKEKYRPEPGEYFQTAVGQAFDRTLGVRVHENISTLLAEDAALDAGPVRKFETEDDLKASGLHRPGIFEPGMSETRARIYAENYDKRRERERIMQGGDENGPWWYGAVGFAGGLIGSLPDPVNLIPFGGAAVTGAKLAGMTAKQVLARSAKAGLVEGAAGNLVSSGYAAYDLNQKGENITFRDVMLDTMFGAALGPLFHGVGSFASRSMARKGMRADMTTVRDALPEGGEMRTKLGESLDAMQRGEAKAYADAAPMLGTLNKQDAIRFLRQTINPTDRLELARAMEFAVGEMVAGRAVDVGPLLKETGGLGRAWDLVKSEIDARTPAGKPDEVLVLLEPSGQDSLGVQRGPMVVTGDAVRASGRQMEKATGSYDGYGLTKAIIKHPEVTRADAMSVPRIMREYDPIAPDSPEHKGRTWIVERNDGRQLIIGETVQPDGGKLVTLHIAKEGKERPLSQRKGSKEKTLEDSRRNFQSSVTTADTGGGFPPRHTRSLQGETKIIRPGEDVNGPAAGHGIDFRAENPEVHEPFTPISKEAAPLLEEHGIDPQTGISHEESFLAELDAEGGLAPADREALLAHGEEAARVDRLEEAALSVAECVLKVVE